MTSEAFPKETSVKICHLVLPLGVNEDHPGLKESQYWAQFQLDANVSAGCIDVDCMLKHIKLKVDN